MYGVPEDLDLSPFHGSLLVQVCIGEFDLQFHFQPEGSISTQGEWLFRSADGVTIDRSCDNASRMHFTIHRVLGQKVISTAIQPPASFELVFESGMTLRFCDSSDHYESIQIYPTGTVSTGIII